MRIRGHSRPNRQGTGIAEIISDYLDFNHCPIRLGAVELIGATTTRTGLRVECVLDTRT